MRWRFAHRFGALVTVRQDVGRVSVCLHLDTKRIYINVRIVFQERSHCLR